MAMSKKEVIAWLKLNADERGIAHWQKRPQQLDSYGIGLTRLRKFAKELGRDHRLARTLSKSNVYDAKIVGILVDDPKKMTREQAEEQVDQGLASGMLVHVFASCGAPLSKTPFAFEIARDWVDSNDPMRRRCGYSLLYELSKRNPKGMDDAYLLDRIKRIRESIHNEEMWVREAMNTALMGIGKRNAVLNAAAIEAAEAIGPVDIDYGDDNQCEPLDVLKHLRSDYLQEKFSRD
ncbi:DNA alkylation repair protein [Neorhodopirellula pilleata]|uniref:DNA alkylation repair enzyme n=1 Tax=Neorhodopirellula pilleata TaxID=2714738 RepID=A0A5C5ZYK2_9BACT|nr:DNA alkylation repair protein [Neorhodopirellula pilleata]TWT91373.1 DNA alkylation repair enzyme [Neorhodopirellula pilleata]